MVDSPFNSNRLNDDCLLCKGTLAFPSMYIFLEYWLVKSPCTKYAEFDLSLFAIISFLISIPEICFCNSAYILGLRDNTFIEFPEDSFMSANA